jgi:SPP1 family phage portal protein
MTGEQIIGLIKHRGNEIMSQIITTTIKDNESRLSDVKKNWEKYRGDVPILHRKNEDPLKISANEKLANDYRGDIVDQIKGFVFAEPIGVRYPDDAGNAFIRAFNIDNDIDALNLELAEYMLSCGYGARLCYIENGTGKTRVMNVKPWECIFIYADSTDRPQYALVFYPYSIMNYDTGKEEKTVRVEWYDRENVTYYIKRGGKFIQETGQVFEDNQLKEIVNPAPHFFDGVPVIEYIPNPRRQCSFAKVESLIDGFDVALSDWLNEIIEFKMSYLKATGASIDEKERMLARATRIINLPDKDSNVDFLTKNLSPEFINNFLDKIDENIYKFSKTANMSSEKFTSGGAESGEARIWKMLSLVFEGVVVENFFTKGLRNTYKILTTSWNKVTNRIDPLKIEFEFKRKLPNDLLYAAQVLEKLWGKMPLEKIYSLLAFVDDPVKLAQEYQNQNAVDLDNLPAEKTNESAQN